MQKFYILLSFMMLSLSVSYAAEHSGKATWEVIEFNPSEWVKGKRTLSISEDIKVNVTLQRHKFETHPVSCVVEGKEYQNFDYVSMYDEASILATNAFDRAYSAYVMFEPVGDFNITQIDFIGHARTSTESSLILGVSITDTLLHGGRPPKDDFNTSYSGGVSRRILDFGPAYTESGTDICQTITAEIAPGDEDFQNQVTFIRLNWNNANFAGFGVDRGSPLDLFGFRIYTNLGPTGIGEIANDSYVMTQNQDVLEFSEISDVQIFSLAGSLVRNVIGVYNLSISDLPKGAYVVKARSIETNTPLAKKILR